MKDQVDALNQVGIPSTFVNSTLTPFEYNQTIQNILYNVYKIIYVAPERLASDAFIEVLNQINVSMFTVDEAHCISQWGHDFRPSYKEIANVILNLKSRPIISAFTATATEIVKQDIIELLHLISPYTLVTGFNRPNLNFSVETPENKTEYVIDFLQKSENNSGIIYCLTRKSVDSLYSKISHLGYKVSKYHGGLTEKERTRNQEDFVYDRTTIMIATNAFGMGIDKSNIRFVIHYNMPKDLESYYQEAGRAGRDGEYSICILLFSRADIVTNKFLLEQTSGRNSTFDYDFISNHKIEYEKLNDIIDYCNTDRCLRKYILEYFGEIPLFDNCNNCSNCLSDVQITDITIDAKKILSCIKRMNERFGSGIVTDVLKGSKSAKIKSLGFDSLSTYGIMNEYSKNTIKDLIYFLITEGYIETFGDQYPVLKLSQNASDVLFNDKPVRIRKKIDKNGSSNKNTEELSYDFNLFIILKDLRKQIAENHNIPPFIVLPDKSLQQMSTYYPLNMENMLKIHGMGMTKFENYGEIFISEISKYVKQNNIVVPEDNNLISKDESSIKDDSYTNAKVNTVAITYDMFTTGLTPKEIADKRNLTIRTVEQHLLKCYELNMNIDLTNLVQSIYEQEIYEKIELIGFEKLRPLKDSLPSEVSYFDINYYLIKYKKEHLKSID